MCHLKSRTAKHTHTHIAVILTVKMVTLMGLVLDFCNLHTAVQTVSNMHALMAVPEKLTKSWTHVVPGHCSSINFDNILLCVLSNVYAWPHMLSQTQVCIQMSIS